MKRNTLLALLIAVLGLSLAACVGAQIDPDTGRTSVYAEPLVGTTRLQEGEQAMTEMIDANTEAIKTVVDEKVAAGLDAAKKEFEDKQTALRNEDEGNRNLLLYGLGLLGLGAAGVAGRKKMVANGEAKAQAKVVEKEEDAARLAAVVKEALSSDSSEPGATA